MNIRPHSRMKHFAMASVLVFIWLCGAPALTPLRAQGVGGGSNYSLFGLGDTRESLGGGYESMGGVGIAVTSPYAINFANPAAWSHLKSTRFQTGFTFRQYNVSNGTRSVNQNNGETQGFSVGFSIDTTLGLSVGFGFIPTSNVSYAFTRENGPLSTRYIGRGGMSQLFLGGAISPIKGLHVGGAFGYNFGSITDTEFIIANDAAFIGSANNVSSNDGLSFATGKFGVQYLVDDWSFGATAMISSPLRVKREDVYRFLGQAPVRIPSSTSVTGDTTIFTATPDSIVASSLESSLPLSLGVGIGKRIGRVAAYLDYTTKDYSLFSYRTEGGNVSFRRANRYALGVSYVGNADYNASFFDALNYNIGAGYHEQYYRVNNVGINELYATLGIGIPITRRSFLDAAVIGGVRGTTDNNLLRETFLRLSFTVNIGEIWFQPFFRE
jgi:hypothetical protein